VFCEGTLVFASKKKKEQQLSLTNSDFREKHVIVLYCFFFLWLEIVLLEGLQFRGGLE
jgi:hypothetical protein